MYIVTGGAGFIGSNLIRGLNHKGIDNIIVVDNLNNGEKHLNLNSLKIRDYVDKNDLAELLVKLGNKKIEGIFHQGACSSTTEPDGRYMLKNNYEVSKAMLDFAQKKRCFFIYASSASVYGDGSKGFAEKPECEYPLNVYAYSKFLFDQHVRRILPRSKIKIVGLRYFNVYGPQERHKGSMASVASHLHKQIVETGTMKLFEGSETFLRDFVYVDDAVKLNLFFAGQDGKDGIYNCGTGKAESFLNIAKVMENLYEPKPQISYIPFPDRLKGKYQTFTQADLTLLRGAGYKEPFTSLREGVEAYAAILKASEGIYRA